KMDDMTAPTGQAPIMAPPVRTNDQILPRIRRYRFHPRPDSPLYLPNEEPVLGYLKFSAKGTKREVFGMPIPAPAEPQAKKHKQATDTSDKPPKAKKSKYGLVRKKRTLKSVAASKAKDVPAMEPQVAHDLLSLQKHKKTSLADQYIFERYVSEPTESFGHDESSYALLGQSDSKEESDKVVLGADEGGQDESQAGPNPDEGQAGPDPGDAGAKVQSIPSPVVHAGSNREHMDLDVADISPQPSTEQLDEGFTATVYPKVQENLKLVVEEQVLLEEPASSLGTLSSLQHLSKDISFGDLFFNDRPSDADKNAETEVESMVNV
nr:hypothetical protein [Tanacetum cinerariifolium]